MSKRMGNENKLLKKINQNKIFIIENNNYKNGMLSSILKINENIDNETKGILISLADMPFVTSEDINKLIRIFNKNNQKIICIPENKGKLGNPILLPKEIYKDLIKDISKLSNDKGLKKLILDKKYHYIKVSL